MSINTTSVASDGNTDTPEVFNERTDTMKGIQALTEEVKSLRRESNEYNKTIERITTEQNIEIQVLTQQIASLKPGRIKKIAIFTYRSILLLLISLPTTYFLDNTPDKWVFNKYKDTITDIASSPLKIRDFIKYDTSYPYNGTPPFSCTNGRIHCDKNPTIAIDGGTLASMLKNGVSTNSDIVNRPLEELILQYSAGEKFNKNSPSLSLTDWYRISSPIKATEDPTGAIVFFDSQDGPKTNITQLGVMIDPFDDNKWKVAMYNTLTGKTEIINIDPKDKKFNYIVQNIPNIQLREGSGLETDESLFELMKRLWKDKEKENSLYEPNSPGYKDAQKLDIINGGVINLESALVELERNPLMKSISQNLGFNMEEYKTFITRTEDNLSSFKIISLINGERRIVEHQFTHETLRLLSYLRHVFNNTNIAKKLNLNLSVEDILIIGGIESDLKIIPVNHGKSKYKGGYQLSPLAITAVSRERGIDDTDLKKSIMNFIINSLTGLSYAPTEMLNNKELVKAAQNNEPPLWLLYLYHNQGPSVAVKILRKNFPKKSWKDILQMSTPKDLKGLKEKNDWGGDVNDPNDSGYITESLEINSSQWWNFWKPKRKKAKTATKLSRNDSHKYMVKYGFTIASGFNPEFKGMDPNIFYAADLIFKSIEYKGAKEITSAKRNKGNNSFHEDGKGLDFRSKNNTLFKNFIKKYGKHKLTNDKKRFYNITINGIKMRVILEYYYEKRGQHMHIERISGEEEGKQTATAKPNYSKTNNSCEYKYEQVTLQPKKKKNTFYASKTNEEKQAEYNKRLQVFDAIARKLRNEIGKCPLKFQLYKLNKSFQEYHSADLFSDGVGPDYIIESITNVLMNSKSWEKTLKEIMKYANTKARKQALETYFNKK